MSAAILGLTDFSYILGILLLFTLFIAEDSSVLVRNFMIRGASEPWGEALRLTSLAPRDYDAALTAGLWRREAAARAVMLSVLAGGLIPPCLAWAGLNQLHPILPPYKGAPPSWETASALAAFTLIVFPAAWMEISLLSALRLGAAMEWAERPGRAGAAGAHLRTFLYSAAAHVPGFLLYWAWTHRKIRLGLPLEATDFGVGDWAGLYLFVLPSMLCAIPLARRRMETRAGVLGRRFRQIFESR